MTEKKDKAFKNVGVRMPTEIYRAAKKQLADNDGSLQSLVVELVREWLSSEGVLPKNKVTPIRDEATDEISRKVLTFFAQAIKPGATAGDQTIARVLMERLGINTAAIRQKGGK